VRVYLRYRKSEADEDDPGTHIVRGHLAVLFNLLMRECPANEAAALGALPGTARRVKLDALVRNAREFVGLYAEFMMQLSRGARRTVTRRMMNGGVALSEWQEMGLETA